MDPTPFRRVTLITPPSAFLLDQRVFVSLGILKIGAVLRDRGIEVDHLDLSGIGNFSDVLRTFLTGSRSEVVGITAVTPQMPSVKLIIQEIRKHDPAIRIILGGPHVTLSCAAAKKEKSRGLAGRATRALEALHSLADVLVCGDGEKAVFRALDPHPPALIDAEDRQDTMFLTDEEYDRSPFPARDLVNLASYRYSIEGHDATSLIGQLGCPFACGFCGGRNSRSLRSIRLRSPEGILSEIEQLHRDHGFTGFMFYDDELNVNRKFLSLLDGLVKLQDKLATELRFRGFVKAELFTEEQALAMRRAGFRWVLCGFESGSPRMLRNMNKKATREENSRMLALARSAGLKVKALMSVGHPGETAQTLQETEQWLLREKPDDFDCSIITAYPGTPYHDEARLTDEERGIWSYQAPATGDLLHSFDVDFLETADYYKGDPRGGYRSFVFTDALGAEELVAGRDRIESSVRASLSLSYPTGAPALHYEHSMGLSPLPAWILRSHRPTVEESRVG